MYLAGVLTVVFNIVSKKIANIKFSRLIPLNVVVVEEESIPVTILKNVAELAVLGRLKIRVRSGDVDPIVVGTSFCTGRLLL